MPLGWSDLPALHDLPAAERRGAILALQHLRATAAQMRRTARGDGPAALTRIERDRLALSADAVTAACRITARDLQPDLKPWHVQGA